jgi:hypothetical protein
MPQIQVTAIDCCAENFGFGCSDYSSCGFQTTTRNKTIGGRSYPRNAPCYSQFQPTCLE